MDVIGYYGILFGNKRIADIAETILKIRDKRFDIYQFLSFW